MLKPASNMTQLEINDFCRATSAVYFAILRSHAARTGVPPMLPDLLMPARTLPCVDVFDDQTLDEAEQFLVRMGFIALA